MNRWTLFLMFNLMIASGFTVRADDSSTPQLPPLPRAVFVMEAAKKAACLPRPSNPRQIINRYDVKLMKWHGMEQALPNLGGILQEVERIYGKAFYPFGKIAVDVDPAYDILGRQVYDAQLQRPKVIIAEGGNLSLLAHEMGHIVGNTGKPGGGTWYQAYNAFVRSPCHSTQYAQSGYSRGRRNEEFAEAFAAYLTTPKTLKNAGYACRTAFNFFRTAMFKAKDPKCLN